MAQYRMATVTQWHRDSHKNTRGTRLWLATVSIAVGSKDSPPVLYIDPNSDCGTQSERVTVSLTDV